MKNLRPLSREFRALIDAIKAEGLAGRREEEREDRGKSRRERITIWLLVFNLAALCWQVREMIKVYEPIREQAQAQQQAAHAAFQQYESAEKSLTLSQRAWVGPQNILFSSEPEIGKPLEAVVQYQNSGRTPALNFFYRVNFSSVSNYDELRTTDPPELKSFMTDCGNSKDWTGGSVVYPSSFANYSMTARAPDSFVDKAVATGEKVVVVQGCFLYHTMDIPRHSYFCFYYKHGDSKIQNLNICPSGHDAD